MTKLIDCNQLTDEAIANMDAAELINSVLVSFDIPDVIERERIQALMQIRAAEVGAKVVVNRQLGAYRQKDKQLEADFKKSQAQDKNDLELRLNDKGVPVPTIDNFLKIMRGRMEYSSIRFNVLRNSPEITHNGEICRWSDADAAQSRNFCEANYGLYSDKKHSDALRILWKEREYNPIKDIVDTLEWDGEERCIHFLAKWAKVEDTAYTREVSRLIFAGGINRLYLPGCKFDDVPVLIGAKQGEGKSTLVKWLAINDSYFSEVTEMDGQKAIEQLEGAWICEVAELLALTKTKEQEAVKSYITRQRDKYRPPYDVNAMEFPRRCIFIGTTNNEQFLRDKTGNRRFYPVTVNSNGYDLHDHEQECRDYIIQCWAEARVKFEQGKMPAFADRSLLSEYKHAQDEAMEDDWRIGVIERYLDNKACGDTVCIKELKCEALFPDSNFQCDLSPKESQEISQIMSKLSDWERIGRIYTTNYGRQRCWRKKSASLTSECELPF
jgi:hypothetical protein